MAKKKKSVTTKKKEFSRNPFSHLKGFAVSGEEVDEKIEPVVPDEVAPEAGRSFAEEMASLGVARINASDSGEADKEEDFARDPEPRPATEQSEEQQFLQAMGELQVSFSDHLPAEEDPPTASARRMKQLRQGKLTPQASLDLHGLKRAEVAEKLQFFLQNAEQQGLQTLLVITGRGLHSADGQPVLRDQAELYLLADGRKWVAEWGRAPKRYGGDGALVLFLRKKKG